jgi:hypothetical protein
LKPEVVLHNHIKNYYVIVLSGKQNENIN